MKIKKIAGGLLFLIGSLLILNSLSTITGFVISENIVTSVSGIFGFIFVVGGIVLFVSGESDLEVAVNQIN